MYDAAVIGGGPAGSSFACRMARAGRSVVLFESRQFPRAKVCGEFVSPAATEILEELLPPARLSELGARRVDRLVLNHEERTIAWSFPERAGAWVLSRSALDTAMIDAARSAGACVMQPADVSRVQYDADGVRVLLTSGETAAARVVIHADGRGRFDAPSPRGPPRLTPVRKGVVGLKCHLALKDPARHEGLWLRAGRGAYIGLVGVEMGVSTLAMVVRTDRVAAHGRDFDALLRELWPALDIESRHCAWLSSGVAGSGYLTPGHRRSFRIGNAAGAVEPVGGEGIGLALWSARTLATLLLEYKLNDLEHVQRRMSLLYRRRLRVRRAACSAAAWALSTPAVVRAAWPILRLPVPRSAVLLPWYMLSGKPARRAPATAALPAAGTV